MAELEATAPEIDEIVAERFGDLRSAIAEHLRTGRNIDEVRFLLRRYFQSFVVRDNDGGRAIVASLRPDVVDDVMADLAGRQTRSASRTNTTACLLHGLLPASPQGPRERRHARRPHTAEEDKARPTRLLVVANSRPADARPHARVSSISTLSHETIGALAFVAERQLEH
jgi:hypothetical protein